MEQIYIYCVKLQQQQSAMPTGKTTESVKSCSLYYGVMMIDKFFFIFSVDMDINSKTPTLTSEWCLRQSS
jgi:hypothetical protein